MSDQPLPIQEQALTWTYQQHDMCICYLQNRYRFSGEVFSPEEARFICNAGKLYAAANRIRKIIERRWRALPPDSEEKKALRDLITAMSLMTGTDSSVVTKTPPGGKKHSQKP